MYIILQQLCNNVNGAEIFKSQLQPTVNNMQQVKQQEQEAHDALC